ncbi:MAG: hemerythrin family protein [Nitrospirae bacterium]|nr:hemerythrin family protein [Nitrospirota bacterium]
MSGIQFGWTEELATGIDIIDVQHKELIKRIIDVMDCAESRRFSTIAETLMYLSHYVIDHFSLEEKYMIDTDYPGFEEHWDEHSHYVKVISALKREPFITPELIHRIETELAQWLLDHILSTDLKMALYIKQFGK